MNGKTQSFTGTKGYIEYIDVLRVISMLSVVFLHIAAGSLRGNPGTAVWHVSNLLTSLMSTSVPVFFMISGAMLLSSDKTVSVKVTLKKRLPKALIPFVAWSFVAIAYFAGLGLVVNGSVNWADAAGRLKNLMSQPSTVHLWFMYVLIPLYILSPLLKRFIDALDKELTRYMLIIWLVFSSVLPTVVSVAPSGIKPLFMLHPSYNLNIMSGYLGFFILGYYLFKYDKRVSKKLLAGIIIFLTILIAGGTWWKTAVDGQYSELFKSYSKVFILLLSSAIFLFFKELLKERSLPARLASLVKWLSSASFGVYLLHNLLVDLISRKINLWPANSLLILFGCYFAALAASLASIVIVSSIKPVCFIFTGLSYKQACESLNLQFLFRRNSSETKMDYILPEAKIN